VLSTIRQLTSDDPRAPMAETALQRLQSDPGAFTAEQTRELSRALNDGKFVDAVTRLANRAESFRNALAMPAPTPGEPMKTGGAF
jgi:hypothetical protein